MFTLSRRRLARGTIAGIVAAACAIFILNAPALAQCSSPDVGRWVNVRPGDEPAQIEIYFAECGDTPHTQTRLGVSVFVRQSGGGLYRRPPVSARRVTDKRGLKWVLAKVPVGGYLDHVWMRRVLRADQELLRVYIRHESLDSKPSAESWHDFRRQ